jgi:hypothetical protein
MKIKDLKFYVKFIFSSETDNVCFSTTDRDMLKNIEFHETSISPMDYRVGDIIHFKPDKNPYVITDIRIRQLVEDTDVLNYGFDSEDCTNMQGAEKEMLFSILISMNPVK